MADHKPLMLMWPDGVPKTEFSRDFVQGMANRMATSFFKYGVVADNFPKKADAIASLLKRIESYEETGNTEFLMDVANYAMIEYMRPGRPDAHFRATDSAESPGSVWKAGAPPRDGASHGRPRREGD